MTNSSSRDLPNNPPRPRLSANLAGVVGNALEWYDFAVFGFLAVHIGSAFFPPGNQTTALLETFSVFAVGYLMRPLGGILFGHIGDRLGRRKALILSIALMTVPTFLIGCLPTYESVGLLAPILLIALRLGQGLSVGGELMSSVTYMAETAPPSHRGYYGSWAIATAVFGLLLGSLSGTLLEVVLEQDQIRAYGWRLPFLSGIGIGAVALWMRRSMPESTTFTDVNVEQADFPLQELLRERSGQLFHLGALVMVYGAGFYLLFVWMPTYLAEFVEPKVEGALLLNTIAMAALIPVILFGGWLSDRIGRRRTLLIASAGLVVLTFPLFAILERGVAVEALACQLAFALLVGLAQGPIPATMTEMFPTRIRVSALGLGYNTTVAIFGGTAPLVATALIAASGRAAAPAFYLASTSAVALIAAYLLKERKGVDLNSPALDSNRE